MEYPRGLFRQERACSIERSPAAGQSATRLVGGAAHACLQLNPIGWLTSAGTAFSWPLATRAQQSERVPKIGVPWPGASPPAPPRMESFLKGLRQLGYVEGQNVAIELRYVQAGQQQLANHAADLVRANIQRWA